MSLSGNHHGLKEGGNTKGGEQGLFLSSFMCTSQLLEGASNYLYTAS